MLALRRVSKAFPGVQALAEVSLELRPGEIHGLVGENGAGKSTAIKILAGLERPDTGQVELDGAPLTPGGPGGSRAADIGFVPQELQLLPEASVAENVMIDRLVTRGLGWIDWPATRREARRHLDRVGLGVAAERPARGLGPAQKQLTQIARALAADARVLLLDEPTSALTEHEARRLFALLRELRGAGVALGFVSHKLKEVLELCDRVSVLRDGRLVGTRPASGASVAELVQMMIGREWSDDRPGVLTPREDREVLRVEGLRRRGQVEGLSFALREGEILGFYGLVGSGRSELARVLIGAEPGGGGRVFVRGREVAIRNVGDTLERLRIGYVSENRKEEGLWLEDEVRTNLTVTVWTRIRSALTRRIDARAERRAAQRQVDALGIKPVHLERRVKQLSGGNQQKVSVGKWLAADCDVLIIDEPTVGVDVGAKRQLQQSIWDLAARDGKSIILISSDLAEIARLASRLLVFREGRIVAEVRHIDRLGKTYEQISQEVAPCFE
jgi:ribose transport system ATP-binding protein